MSLTLDEKPAITSPTPLELPTDLEIDAKDALGRSLKTTASGIVLVPQPSDDPQDPLNWSFTKKHVAMIALAFETFLVKFSATLLAPGAHQLSTYFHITLVQATYISTIAAFMPAISAFLWIPLSQRIGRRPVLLMGNIMTIVFTAALSQSTTYGQALGFRMLAYFGGSVGGSIAPAAISEMFFLHEKGSRMGVYTFFFVAAPYLGAVCGGSIIQNESLGWRWTQYFSIILYSGLFFIILLCVPETIYNRATAAQETEAEKKTLSRKLLFRTPNNPDSYLHTFTRPYEMFAYPAVFLPCFWFSLCFFPEVANTAGFPLHFGSTTKWKFTTAQVGFCSFSGLIGAIIGECLAGPFCDFVARRHLKKGKVWHPEVVLKVIWTSVVCVPAGLLLYGLELNFPTSWEAALAGISIFTVGLEIAITVILTYITDSYPAKAAECTIVFQFCSTIMSSIPNFFTPQWIVKDGAKAPYIFFALLPLVFLPFGIGIFMLKGPEIRKKGKWFGLGSNDKLSPPESTDE